MFSNRTTALFISACALAVVSLCIVTALATLTSDRGGYHGDPSIRGRKLSSSYANTFPSRWEIRDMVKLADDIFYIDSSGNVDSSRITASKWTLKLWVDAEWSVEAMIVQGEGKTVATFRGSERELDDWMTNFEFIRTPSKFAGAPTGWWDGVWVHKGFQDALTDPGTLTVKGGACNPICETLHGESSSSAVDRLEREIIDLIGSNGELHVTGHSLGGAKAHYFGVWMAAKYPSMKVKVITIGQPRIGSDTFKSWSEGLSNLAVWRVVNDSDIVPRLPPTISGYDHAGHLYQIDEGERTTAYYRQVGGGNYEGAPTSWYYRQSIPDHSSSEYVSHCDNKINVGKYWPTSFKLKPVKKTCSWWQWWC